MQRFITIATLVCCLILAACTSKQTNVGPAPQSGKVSYNIHYSRSIMSNRMSSFFPSKMVATYNANGIRLDLKGPLGVYEFSIINFGDASNMLINLQGNRIYCPIEADSTFCDSLMLSKMYAESEITYSDSLTNIGGWMSKQMTVRYFTGAEQTMSMDVYFVPTCGKSRKISNFPLEVLPGMVTAINIQHGTDVITIIADNVDSTAVSDKAFQIPDKYRVVNADEISTLLETLADV